ncbi:MAG: hypothetical protein ACYS76_06705 [Planctomycetota bacterium]|jgi:hypothetical protein
MSEDGKSMSALTKVLIILAILIVGWNLYTGAKIQEIGIPGIFTMKFGSNEEPPLPPDPPKKKKVQTPELRKYLMDKQPNRIIIVTHLQHNNYRIKEPTSPWPWEGVATIDGGQLTGEAKFRNSLATMRIEGVVRGDESIVIKYKFITGSDGKPSAGKVDNHIWYPSN